MNYGYLFIFWGPSKSRSEALHVAWSNLFLCVDLFKSSILLLLSDMTRDYTFGYHDNDALAL